MPEPESARVGAQRPWSRRRRLIVGLTALALVVIGLAAVAIVEGAASRQVKGLVAARHPVRMRPGPTEQLAAVAAIGDADIHGLAALGLPIYCGGRHGNEVAFTFDDGPGVYTHYAIKKLNAAHERATFFVVGRSMDHWPRWVPRELKLGAIGDHTYTHPFLPALSPTDISSQIERTEQKIEATSGQPVYLFRPPYGAHDPAVDRIVKQLGLLEIMWSVDSRDSLGADWAAIIRNVEAGLYPGAIILMHENRGQTMRALTTLLPELHRRHLRSVSLPELLATDPPSVAQIRGGEAACGGPSRISPRRG